MPLLSRLLCLLTLAGSTRAAAAVLDKLMNDTAKFWDAFRDPTTGLYCDHFAFDSPDPSAAGRDDFAAGVVSNIRPAQRGSCAAAMATQCAGTPSATECDACAAQHQHTLRSAGCTGAEIQQWCAAASHHQPSPAPVCQGQQYSSAACGMGLISSAAFVEMGLLSRDEGEQRALQTLTSLATQWPKEPFSGFFNHFTSAPAFEPSAEFSTVDTAEMAMGALFAGNYFGGTVQAAAQKLVRTVRWSVAIEAGGGPTTYPTINGSTGVPGGNIRPYNEYFILSYLANIMEEGDDTPPAPPESPALQPPQRRGNTSSSEEDRAALLAATPPGRPGRIGTRVKSRGVAQRYFRTYYQSEGGSAPPKGRGGYPAQVAYRGHVLLTDNANRHFMSSFIPQFCFYQTKYALL
eukprot:COSAG05_NODE_1114_length_5840_cov_2.676886_7_plen_405_part_00